MKLHKHHCISAKKQKESKDKKVGMKVHRHNPPCALFCDAASVRSIVKARMKSIFTAYLFHRAVWLQRLCPFCIMVEYHHCGKHHHCECVGLRELRVTAETSRVAYDCWCHRFMASMSCFFFCFFFFKFVSATSV